MQCLDLMRSFSMGGWLQTIEAANVEASGGFFPFFFFLISEFQHISQLSFPQTITFYTLNLFGLLIHKHYTITYN